MSKDIVKEMIGLKSAECCKTCSFYNHHTGTMHGNCSKIQITKTNLDSSSYKVNFEVPMFARCIFYKRNGTENKLGASWNQCNQYMPKVSSISNLSMSAVDMAQLKLKVQK